MAYRLFGALFLYPSQERLESLIATAGELRNESDSLAAFPFFGPWRRLLTALCGLAEGTSTEIEGEYVRLFLVNPETPPYESFYLDPKRQVAGWIAAQLAREYADLGLTLSPGRQEVPDHVSVELELMAFLCGLEMQAWQREIPEDRTEILERQRAFLDDHLGNWCPVFARQVVAASRKNLYAVAAEATHAFLVHDRDLVALLLDRSRATANVVQCR
jgi:TorA maturation chaperone TorD